MKEYKKIDFEVIEFEEQDVITESVVETPGLPVEPGTGGGN